MKYEGKLVIDSMPTKTSSGAEWQEWYKALKSRLGKKEANSIWLEGWSLRAGSGSHASTNELRTYMKKQGINIDANILEDITDVGMSLVNFGSGIVKTGIIGGMVVTGLIAAGVIILVFNIARNPDKTISVVQAGAAAGVSKGLI
jgi:hypothetical protein